MNSLKTLAVLFAILLTIPVYFRNQAIVDREAGAAWFQMRSFWSSESPETRQLRKALSNAGNMGTPGKTAQQAREEAMQKSAERVEQQLQKDVAGEPRTD